jgi:hypothetical protein
MSIFLVKKLPPYTLAGFDLTTLSSSLLGGNWQAETIPLDHAARAKCNFLCTDVICNRRKLLKKALFVDCQLLFEFCCSITFVCQRNSTGLASAQNSFHELLALFLFLSVVEDMLIASHFSDKAFCHFVAQLEAFQHSYFIFYILTFFRVISIGSRHLGISSRSIQF